MRRICLIFIILWFTVSGSADEIKIRELDLDNLGKGRFYPVFYAENLTIDGNLDDWEGYPEVYLPALTSQLWKKKVDAEDLSAKIYLAWDEDRLYLGAGVKDDVHYTYSGAEMWRGDSLQIAFGKDGILDDIGIYGPAYGMQYIDGRPQIWCYTEGIADINPEDVSLNPELSGIIFKSKPGEGKINYEISIPWQAIFREVPREKFFLFDILINDNDGQERGFIEWTPGIGAKKNHTGFSVCTLLGPAEKQKRWSTFLVERERMIIKGEDTRASLYVINYGNTALKFQVTGYNRELTVLARKIVRLDLPVSGSTAGKKGLIVEVKELSTGEVQRESCDINVLYVAGTKPDD